MPRIRRHHLHNRRYIFQMRRVDSVCACHLASTRGCWYVALPSSLAPPNDLHSRRQFPLLCSPYVFDGKRRQSVQFDSRIGYARLARNEILRRLEVYQSGYHRLLSTGCLTAIVFVDAYLFQILVCHIWSVWSRFGSVLDLHRTSI